MQLPKSKLTRSQVKTFSKTTDGYDIDIEVRFDDRCGNGHNSFAITGTVYKAGRVRTDRNLVTCGMCHDFVENYFPELTPYLKWHLTSTDGPMHYVANTTYHAKEVRKFQHSVRLKDDTLNARAVYLGIYSDDGLERLRKRFADFELEWDTSPTMDSKEANLDAARRCAIWPDASLEDLRDEQKLLERLPALMEEFKRDIESLGSTY